MSNENQSHQLTIIYGEEEKIVNVYLLDTFDTIQDRICAIFDTLPKFLLWQNQDDYVFLKEIFEKTKDEINSRKIYLKDFRNIDFAEIIDYNQDVEVNIQKLIELIKKEIQGKINLNFLEINDMFDLIYKQITDLDSYENFNLQENLMIGNIVKINDFANKFNIKLQELYKSKKDDEEIDEKTFLCQVFNRYFYKIPEKNLIFYDIKNEVNDFIPNYVKDQEKEDDQEKKVKQEDDDAEIDFDVDIEDDDNDVDDDLNRKFDEETFAEKYLQDVKDREYFFKKIEDLYNQKLKLQLQNETFLFYVKNITDKIQSFIQDEFENYFRKYPFNNVVFDIHVQKLKNKSKIIEDKMIQFNNFELLQEQTSLVEYNTKIKLNYKDRLIDLFNDCHCDYYFPMVKYLNFTKILKNFIPDEKMYNVDNQSIVIFIRNLNYFDKKSSTITNLQNTEIENIKNFLMITISQDTKTNELFLECKVKHENLFSIKQKILHFFRKDKDFFVSEEETKVNSNYRVNIQYNEIKINDEELSKFIDEKFYRVNVSDDKKDQWKYREFEINKRFYHYIEKEYFDYLIFSESILQNYINLNEINRNLLFTKKKTDLEEKIIRLDFVVLKKKFKLSFVNNQTSQNLTLDLENIDTEEKKNKILIIMMKIFQMYFKKIWDIQNELMLYLQPKKIDLVINYKKVEKIEKYLMKQAGTNVLSTACAKIPKILNKNNPDYKELFEEQKDSYSYFTFDENYKYKNKDQKNALLGETLLCDKTDNYRIEIEKRKIPCCVSDDDKTDQGKTSNPKDQQQYFKEGLVSKNQLSNLGLINLTNIFSDEFYREGVGGLSDNLFDNLFLCCVHKQNKYQDKDAIYSKFMTEMNDKKIYMLQENIDLQNDFSVNNIKITTNEYKQIERIVNFCEYFFNVNIIIFEEYFQNIENDDEGKLKFVLSNGYNDIFYKNIDLTKPFIFISLSHSSKRQKRIKACEIICKKVEKEKYKYRFKFEENQDLISKILNKLNYSNDKINYFYYFLQEEEMKKYFNTQYLDCYGRVMALKLKKENKIIFTSPLQPFYSLDINLNKKEIETNYIISNRNEILEIINYFIDDMEKIEYFVKINKIKEIKIKICKNVLFSLITNIEDNNFEDIINKNIKIIRNETKFDHNYLTIVERPQTINLEQFLHLKKISSITKYLCVYLYSKNVENNINLDLETFFNQFIKINTKFEYYEQEIENNNDNNIKLLIKENNNIILQIKSDKTKQKLKEFVNYYISYVVEDIKEFGNSKYIPNYFLEELDFTVKDNNILLISNDDLRNHVKITQENLKSNQCNRFFLNNFYKDTFDTNFHFNNKKIKYKYSIMSMDDLNKIFKDEFFNFLLSYEPRWFSIPNNFDKMNQIDKETFFTDNSFYSLLKIVNKTIQKNVDVENELKTFYDNKFNFRKLLSSLRYNKEKQYISLSEYRKKKRKLESTRIKHIKDIQNFVQTFLLSNDMLSKYSFYNFKNVMFDENYEFRVNYKFTNKKLNKCLYILKYWYDKRTFLINFSEFEKFEKEKEYKNCSYILHYFTENQDLQHRYIECKNIEKYKFHILACKDDEDEIVYIPLFPLNYN
jgi:hypothetical protein